MAEDPAAEALAAARALLTFEFACKLSDLPEGARRCVQLPSSKRSVMLLNLRGQIYCMDQACYHHGGPLINGDIEEMGGKVTIKCPWHAYHIAVETGEGLYMGMDMALDARGRSQPSPPKVKSKGVKQRTHFVEVRDDEDVFVADSSLIPGTSSCADVFKRRLAAVDVIIARLPSLVPGSAIIMSDIYAFRPVTIPEKLKGEVKIHSRFE